MAETAESETAVVKDLDSLAVQFGQSLLESDLKAYNDESSDVYADDDDDDEDDGDDSNLMASADTTSNDVSLDNDLETAKLNSSIGPEICASVTATGEKIYRCQDCGLTYSKSSSFSNHRLAHHPSVCTHCGRRFSMPESLESHLQLVCERKGPGADVLFECHICQKKLTSKKILQRHLRVHSNTGRFPCTVCSKTFGLKSSLEFHMKSHDEHKPFKCKLCFITFTEKSTAIRHLKRQHSKTQDFNTLIESNLKPVNPLELANRINLAGASDHDESKPDIKVEKDAKKVHSTPSLKSLLEQPLASLEKLPKTPDLSNHLERSLVKTPEPKGTIVAGALDRSENSSLSESLGGSGAKVYSCHLCDKWYSHSSSLTKHMKKHDSLENSQFVCNICNKKCMSKRDLNCHVLTHSGVQSFTCPICDSSVARKSSLVRHIRKGHKYSMEEAKEIVKMQIEDQENAESHSELEGINDDSLMDTHVETTRNTRSPIQETVLDTHEPELKFQHFTCSICEQIFLERAKLIEHMTTVHEQSSSKSITSGDVVKDNVGYKTEGVAEYLVCSFCHQLFTGRALWKEHMCNVHGFTGEQADSCIGVNIETLKGDKDSIDTNIKNFNESINKINSNLFETTLNVVVEKDKEGVQKVIKVMPEAKPLNADQYFTNSVKIKEPPKPLDENAAESLYKPYCCTLCGTRFVEKSSVRRHLKRTHNFSPEQAREYMIRSDYTREIPVSKATPMETVVESEPPKAQVSDTPAQNWEKSDAEEAEDQEDRNVQRTYLCSVCKKRFMLRSSVRRHLRKIHNFSPEEARECDILAEENSENIYKIRKPHENESNTLKSNNSKTPHRSKGRHNKAKEEVTCKFCGQKFRQRFGLKRHLISAHQLDQKEAEAALEEEMNETKKVNLACSLCLTEFDSAASLQTHLMKLHRVSETVAKRIMFREEMSDYTQGIEKDPYESAVVSDDFDDIEPSRISQSSVKLYNESNMEENESVDVDETSEHDENDMLFSLKTDKNALLADLNFEAINPWGSMDKVEGIESENLLENDSGLDFKLTDTEKLMDTSEAPNLMNNDIMNNENENSETKADEVIDKPPASPGPSVYLHQKKTYDCPICGKKMSDASARSKHIHRHEGTAGFKCGLCARIYTQLRLIESHLRTHCGFGVKCGLCHIYFAERHGVKRHLHRTHGIEPNTEVSESSILNCTIDCSNVIDNANNYIVIDLAKAKDISEVVPNVLLGKKEDIIKWEQEREALLAKTDGEEKTEVKTEEKTSEDEDSVSNQADNENDPKQITQELRAKQEAKGSKPAKIDSVISSLRKKLLTKNLNESETDDQSDTGSQTETDSQSVYSAENFSPLKLKLKKKPKLSESADENTEVEKNIDQNDDNDYDSDKTVDCDFDDQKEEVKESNCEDIDKIDAEIYHALMPHFDKGNTDNLDAVSMAISALTESEKKQKPKSPKKSSKKPVQHLNCWECGKSYSSYKSFREHRRKKHPLSCNQCRQVFVDVLLYQSHMQAHGEGNKVSLDLLVSESAFSFLLVCFKVKCKFCLVVILNVHVKVPCSIVVMGNFHHWQC